MSERQECVFCGRTYKTFFSLALHLRAKHHGQRVGGGAFSVGANRGWSYCWCGYCPTTAKELAQHLEWMGGMAAHVLAEGLGPGARGAAG